MPSGMRQKRVLPSNLASKSKKTGFFLINFKKKEESREI